MLANLERLRNALNEWLITEGHLGDATFYTDVEWRERGEQLHEEFRLVFGDRWQRTSHDVELWRRYLGVLRSS